MFTSLYIRIYTLPYHHLFGVCLCGILLFGELRQKIGRWRGWRACLALVLLTWATVVLWSTVFSRSEGLVSNWALLPFHSYREALAGGNPEILRSNLMNVVLFTRAGLLTAALLPDPWPVKRRLLCVAIVFFPFSLGIEWAQFSRRFGWAEIDDVLHNTLGAALGCLALSLEPKLFRR